MEGREEIWGAILEFCLPQSPYLVCCVENTVRGSKKRTRKIFAIIQVKDDGVLDQAASNKGGELW